MRNVREINWECRSKWSELKLSEYKYVSKMIKQTYQHLVKSNQMLDLESIVILGKESYGYRVSFYIRTMLNNTIIGSSYVLVSVDYEN